MCFRICRDLLEIQQWFMNGTLGYQKQIPNFKLKGCMFSNSNSYITTVNNYIKLIQTMHRQSIGSVAGL